MGHGITRVRVSACAVAVVAVSMRPCWTPGGRRGAGRLDVGYARTLTATARCRQEGHLARQRRCEELARHARDRHLARQRRREELPRHARYLAVVAVADAVAMVAVRTVGLGRVKRCHLGLRVPARATAARARESSVPGKARQAVVPRFPSHRHSGCLVSRAVLFQHAAWAQITPSPSPSQARAPRRRPRRGRSRRTRKMRRVRVGRGAMLCACVCVWWWWRWWGIKRTFRPLWLCESPVF